MKDRTRNTRLAPTHALRLWCVDDGEPTEHTEVVWAADEEAARRIGWRYVFKSLRDRWGDGFAEVSARPALRDDYGIPERGVFIDRFTQLFAPSTPRVETRDGVLREAGLHWEGQPTCSECDLSEPDGTDVDAYRVCSECGLCGECGHDDDCPEKSPEFSDGTWKP